MTEQSPSELLESVLTEVENHHNDGNQRIKAWYSDDYDPPKNLSELEDAPHQSLIESSAELLVIAKKMVEVPRSMSNPYGDVELLLYGVATERLLTGIYLKLNPGRFVEQLDKNGRTPSFWACEEYVKENLSGKINDEEKELLVSILEIVRQHRNNQAHLGYHRYTHHQVNRLILEVGYLLIGLYADEFPSELATIREIIDKGRQETSSSYRTIRFNLDVVDGA